MNLQMTIQGTGLPHYLSLHLDYSGILLLQSIAPWSESIELNIIPLSSMERANTHSS